MKNSEWFIECLEKRMSKKKKLQQFNACICHEFERQLVEKFKQKENGLLLDAATDTTKRWTLVFILDWPEFDIRSRVYMGTRIGGGTLHYDKKLRRFTYIQYSLNGWAQQIFLKYSPYLNND